MDFERDFPKLRSDIVFQTGLLGEPFTFHGTWGLFSPTAIDEGSRLLLENIEIKKNGISLDIGCGYGALGIPIAKLSPEGKAHLVDKDYVAIEYAKKNAKLNGVNNCEIYLSNGFSKVPNVEFDLIVSNLPAKVGKELFWIFLDDAKKHLKPGGRIYVVTISGLREFIKRNFNDFFGNYEKVKQGRSYTVGLAVKK
ncbi:MAG: class I SAM-dependent methyltransferase [Candidatus Liptonbacteria bacterium]|nr:class I SAM-dependent methyltransferase [Candidatus Liptonbacteria bacterium]